MAQALADYGLCWTCSCGYRSWSHHEACDKCGQAKPPPPPEPEPTNAPLTEPPPVGWSGGKL